MLYGKLVVTIILRFYQRNGKFPLPCLKQRNYPVIPIYGFMEVEEAMRTSQLGPLVPPYFVIYDPLLTSPDTRIILSIPLFNVGLWYMPMGDFHGLL